MDESASKTPWECLVPLLPSTVQARALMKPGAMPGSGRSLVATKDISAGQLVYESQNPQSLRTVDLAFSTRVCLHCGDIPSCEECEDGDIVTQPLQCHGCEAAAWCSAECKSADAELHAMTCRFVRPLLLELRLRHSSFMGESADQEPVEWTEGINLLTLLAMLCLRAQHLSLLPARRRRSQFRRAFMKGALGW